MHRLLSGILVLGVLASFSFVAAISAGGVISDGEHGVKDVRRGDSGVDEYMGLNRIAVVETPEEERIVATQPLRVRCGEGGGVGIVIDCAAVERPADLAVFGADGDILLPYEIERLPNATHPGVIWVRGTWRRDGEVQMLLAYGDGPADRQDPVETWGGRARKVQLVHHYREAGRSDRWTKEQGNPVLPGRYPGSYTYHDPTVYFGDGRYYLFAGGYGGVSQSASIDVFTAESGEDYVFSGSAIHASSVDASMVSDPDVVEAPDDAEHRYWMVYQTDGTQIRIAKSDSLTSGWADAGALLETKEISPERITEPTIIRDPAAPPDRRWKMLFTASGRHQEGIRREDTWYAYSPDGDENWHVHERNPVLQDVADAELIREGGRYYQYANWGKGTGIFKFVAADPMNWTLTSREPVLRPGGEDAWDAVQTWAPDVVRTGQGYYLAYQSGIDIDGPMTIGAARATVTDSEVAFDSTGNGWSGGGANASWRREGRFGSGIGIGSGARVTIKDAGRMIDRDGFTMVVWVRTNRTADGPLITARSGRGGDVPILTLLDGQVATGLGGIPADERLDPAVLTDGQWHSVTLMYEQNRLELALDGRVVASTDGIRWPAKEADLVIGHAGARSFTGTIDEFRIYGAGKDDIWMRAVHDAGTVTGPGFFRESPSLGDTCPTDGVLPQVTRRICLVGMSFSIL